MIQNYLRPDARALIRGGKEFPAVCGEVLFYQMKCSVVVRATVSGLPDQDSLFYGFHIHEGSSCSGEEFSETKGHYNPQNQPHPKHAGDLPPLISCSGNAYLEFKTARFNVKEIIGRTVIIHGGTDDFRTQPSGDAGEKIACGVIRKV